MSPSARALALRLFLAVVLVVAGVLAVLGVLAFTVLLGLVVATAVLRFAPRLGADLAFASAIIVALVVVLAVPLLTRAVPVPLEIAPAAALVLIGLMMAAGIGALPRPSRRAVVSWSASALGGAVWVVVTGASLLSPSSSAMGWVLGGDSANNLLFARQGIARGSIWLAADENPVPLPAALLTSALVPGRGGAPDDLLRHDVMGLVLTWSAVIVVVCLLAGRLLAVFAGDRPHSVVAAAVGSVLPLTWFVSGYPIEFGFFNAHLAFVLLLAGLLVALHGRRQPALALGVLALSAVLVLATWAPLVLVPAAVGLVIVVRDRRALWLTRGPSLLLLGLAGVALVGWGLAATLPVLLAQGDALGAPGGVFVFSRWFVLAILGGGLVAGLALRRDARSRGVIVVVVVVALSVAWAVLLYGARASADPFVSYYPAKVAWLGAVLVVLLTTGVAWRLAGGVRPQSSRRLARAGVAVAVALAVVVAPALRTAYVQIPPLVRIVSGSFAPGGDVQTERIFSQVDPVSPRLLWRSGDPNERGLNFWSLMMAGGIEPTYLPLRIAAGGEYGDSTEELCRVIGLIPAETTVVVTADGGLEAEYTAVCSEPVRFDVVR